MPGEVQGVTMCCDCWGGGQCACVCGREQMPAMRWGVSAHFDCSARTDRWAGGAQVGVSVGCGGLWVMPDFSALYAPHVFILHMLQTSAPLPTSYCVFLSLQLFFNIHFTVWAGLSSQMHRWSPVCASEKAQMVYEHPLTLYQICLAVSRVSTTKSLCMCVRMHDKTAPDNIVILCGVPE